MKPKHKLLKTILWLLSPFILNYFIMHKKYIQYENSSLLQLKYETYHQVPNNLGIALIPLSIIALISIILIWIKKSKEEKLIKRGYHTEVNNILNLHKQDILSKYEVEQKFLEILRDNEEIEKKENDGKRNMLLKERFHSSLTNLEELKNKNILTEDEYKIKVANLKIDLEQAVISPEILNDLVLNYDFQSKEDLTNEKYNPSMNERTDDKLLKILQSEKGNYNESAVYQAYLELLNRCKE